MSIRSGSYVMVAILIAVLVLLCQITVDPRVDEAGARGSDRRYWYVAGATLFGFAYIGGLKMYMDAHRPKMVQIIAPAYRFSAACPPRDYKYDYYIYRGCANPVYAIDAYDAGIDQYGWTKNTNWYRIGNDAIQTICYSFDENCRTFLTISNLYAQRPGSSTPRFIDWWSQKRRP
jgi:hypothetical protein